MAVQFRTRRIAYSAQVSVKNLAACVTKSAQPFSVVAVALLLFVGAAHAQQNSEPCTSTTSYCLFVSDYGNGGGIELCRDDGMFCNPKFIRDGHGVTSEGVSCLSGSANVMYTASAGSTSIGVYDLTTGVFKDSAGPFGNGDIASLSTNSAGTVLYEAEFAAATILGLAPVIPPKSPWLTFLYTTAPKSANSHDTVVAPNGNLFATQVADLNSGVQVYDPTLAKFLGQFLQGSCANFSGTQHCWESLAGMAWDMQGNLWVSSNAPGATGIYEFDPSGKPINFTSDPSENPIGIAVAPATDPSNPNYIIIANVTAGVGNVIKIDPKSCTGSVAAPGTCQQSTFISSATFALNGQNGRPKYPVYYTSCPNPDLNGHIEICKQSDPNHPVSGTFDFTATAPFFSSGQIQVPVGDCSGSIQVPAADPHGVVTVTETPTLGDLVSNVTAFSYDKYGFYVDELKSWTLPELHADVYVVPGDVELETVATFTNYAAPPGQLKICKIAGTDDLIDKGPFTFIVQKDGQLPTFYYIKAGPADQGGYCQLAGTFAANTPLLVSEPPYPFNDFNYKVSNISVDPPDRGSNYNYTTQSVIVTIGEGITEVSFTNVKKGKQIRCLACPN